MLILIIGLLKLVLLFPASAEISLGDLSLLLRTNKCIECRLEGIDLVLSDLKGADLSNSNLRGANLSGSDLTNANLMNSDLSFANLSNTNLTGAILSGAKLNSASLENANMYNAKLNYQSLSNCYWLGVVGLDLDKISYTQLHNTGIIAFTEGKYNLSINYFNKAINRLPYSPLTWLARALSYSKLNQYRTSISDFHQAAFLYKSRGDNINANIIYNHIDILLKIQSKTNYKQINANGLGIDLFKLFNLSVRNLSAIAFSNLSI